ncbi:hypothetical protein LCGC14_1931960, partial [marine sediment metagenome]
AQKVIRRVNFIKKKKLKFLSF